MAELPSCQVSRVPFQPPSHLEPPSRVEPPSHLEPPSHRQGRRSGEGRRLCIILDEMKRLVLLIVAGSGVIAAVIAARTMTTAAVWQAGAAQPIDSPAAANGSAQPQLSVLGDKLLLSWIEIINADATLKVAERTPTGWSEARKVAAGRDWFVNWADVPSVVRLADGSLAAHWLKVSAASPYAYDVRLAFSRDEGRSWTQATSPHHDGTHTEHGFASLFQAPGAGLGLVWLDGREMKAAKPDEEPAGAMGLRAAVFDTEGTQVSETVIDDRVCECCPTAAAVTSEGPIVAYRDRSQDEIRDIYVSRLAGGRWSEPAPVHRDNWQINACPVNGPALSASGREVALAWFTVADDQGRVFVAFSSDAGRTFAAPVRVDEVSALGRVDVELLPDGAAVVSWIEIGADKRSEFRIRRVDRSGQRSESMSVAGVSANRSSGYPRMARRGDELVFAWTDPEAAGSRVRTATARLTP